MELNGTENSYGPKQMQRTNTLETDGDVANGIGWMCVIYWFIVWHVG